MGVLHHLPDPVKGLRALAERLNEGGIMHIFVYSALGRREIMLMQEALALLQGPWQRHEQPRHCLQQQQPVLLEVHPM